MKLEDRLVGLDAAFYGVAADSPEQLTRFREEIGIPAAFGLLSDPDLTTADLLGVQISKRHPKAKSYPRKAFLQPGLFIWRKDGSVAYQWRQTPKITNLFGAANRPAP